MKIVSLYNTNNPTYTPFQTNVRKTSIHFKGIKNNLANNISKSLEEPLFNHTRGRIPKIELNLIQAIEKITNKELRNSLIKLFNNICANNRNGSHTIRGITLSNKEIATTVLEKLKEITTNNTEIKKENTQISNKTKDSNIDINSILANKYTSLKKAYDEIITLDTTNKSKNKDTIDSLFEDISILQNSEGQNEYILSALDKFYAKSLLDIAKINQNIRNNNIEKEKLYNDIIHKRITQSSITDWNLSYSNLPITFQKFNLLHNIGLPNKNNYATIADMLVNGKIKDFDLLSSNNNKIYLKISTYNNDNVDLQQQFKNLINFYNLIIPLNKMAKNGYKLEYDLISNQNSYPYIINFLSPNKSKEPINEEFLSNCTQRLEIIKNILKSKEIFPSCFIPHSKTRFLERFIFNDYSYTTPNILKQYTTIKVQGFLSEIQEALNKGIKCNTYNKKLSTKGINIKFYSEIFQRSIHCGIDTRGYIHTIY